MTTPTIKNTPKSPKTANLPGNLKVPHSNPPIPDDSAALLSFLDGGNGLDPTMSASGPNSHPASFIQRFGLDLHTVPADHDDRAPVVVPLGAGNWSHPEPYPFAVIIALRHGEKIAAKPRVCIYVSLHNDKIYFGDGVFAVRSKCNMIVSSKPFLELSNALQLDRKDFSALLNFKDPEEPHMRTKNWHLRDTRLEVVGTQLGASAALCLFNNWAKMDKDGDMLADRMSFVLDLPEGVKEKDPEFGSRLNSFTHFCHDIGLKMRNKHNFSLQIRGLYVCLAIALQIRNTNAAVATGD